MKVIILGILLLLSPVVALTQEVPEVDTLLVLTVDASGSISKSELDLQVLGILAALQDFDVLNVISSNSLGKVAIAVVMFNNEPVLVQDWMVISDFESVQQFAATVQSSYMNVFEGGRGITSTNLAGAINYSVNLIQNAPYKALRRVIDVSGDGEHNMADKVDYENRDSFTELTLEEMENANLYALSQGVMINGLPIGRSPKSEETYYYQELVDYYRDNVVRYTGGFVMSLYSENGFASYKEAFERKLMIELAQDTKRFARDSNLLSFE